MDVRALGDGDEREIEFLRQLGDGAAVGKNPGTEDDVESELPAQFAHASAQRARHEPMVPAAADFWQVGRGDVLRGKLRVLRTWLPGVRKERQRGADGQYTDFPAIGEMVEQSRVVESAVGLGGVGKEIRDEEQLQWRVSAMLPAVSPEGTRPVAEVAKLAGIAGMAGLGGMKDVHQLAGGDVVEANRGIAVGPFGEGAIKGAHGLAEKHAGILGLRRRACAISQRPSLGGPRPRPGSRARGAAGPSSAD